MAWKEYYAEHRLNKELQESMDMCTGCCDITEILLKTALNTIQSINCHVLVFISYLFTDSPNDLTKNAVLMTITGYFIGGVANLISAAISADLG